jgi:hypothetical protein
MIQIFTISRREKSYMQNDRTQLEDGRIVYKTAKAFGMSRGILKYWLQIPATQEKMSISRGWKTV